MSENKNSLDNDWKFIEDDDADFNSAWDSVTKEVGVFPKSDDSTDGSSRRHSRHHHRSTHEHSHHHHHHHHHGTHRHSGSHHHGSSHNPSQEKRFHYIVKTNEQIVENETGYTPKSTLGFAAITLLCIVTVIGLILCVILGLAAGFILYKLAA